MATFRYVLIADDREFNGEFIVAPDRVRIDTKKEYKVAFFNASASKVKLTFTPASISGPIEIPSDEDRVLTVQASNDRKKISYRIDVLTTGGSFAPVIFAAGDPEIIVE